MEKTVAGTSHIAGHATSHKLLQGLGWGFLGGLTGTLIMDLLLMCAMRVLTQPVMLFFFSIVGDTRYPGGKKIENVYFHQVSAAYDEATRGYLEQACQSGKDFAG